MSRRGDETMELSNLFVCLMGMGTVFAGLICLVFICYLVGFAARDRKKPVAERNAPAEADKATVTENREELVAAISAAVAEELGEDVSRIRILSLKRK